MKTEEDQIDEFNFQLKNPIKYSLRGESINGKFIKLRAPTAKEYQYITILKSSLFKAIEYFTNKNTVEDKTGEKDSSDSKMDADAIISAFYVSGIDMNELMKSSIALFEQKGLAEIEGEVNLKGSHINQMDINDLEKMTGEYIENFILPSVMQED